MLIASFDVKKIFKNIRVFFNTKKVVKIITVMCIMLVIFLVLFTMVTVSHIKNGSLIGNIMQKLGNISNNNLFNMKSYYAEYEMTVCSNKNTNTYKVKEWFKEGIGTKFEFLDSQSNKVYIVLTNRQVIICNESQKNIFQVEEYSAKYSNLMSIKTCMTMYESVAKNTNKKNCCFSTKTFEKNNNIKLIIKNSIDEQRECECEYRYLIENIYEMELNVNSKTGVPKTYVITDKNKEPFISIVYNKFDINVNLEDNVFSIT